MNAHQSHLPTLLGQAIQSAAMNLILLKAGFSILRFIAIALNDKRP